jgi:hypothetical protein
MHLVRDLTYDESWITGAALVDRGGRMARKPAARRTKSENAMVDFDFGNRTYQIDPDRRKVYRRFVEIETAKAAEIFSTWRSQNAPA